MKNTNSISMIGLLLLPLTFAACQSPQERRDTAEAEFQEERVRLVREYNACIEKAHGDEAMLRECEAILKAVEAMK